MSSIGFHSTVGYFKISVCPLCLPLTFKPLRPVRNMTSVHCLILFSDVMRLFHKGNLPGFAPFPHYGLDVLVRPCATPIHEGRLG